MACHQHYGLIALLVIIAGATATLVGPVRQGVSSTCEPFSSLMPICSGVGYSNATFPNHRNQNISQASVEIRHFLPLIMTGCSNALVHLLCAVYAPFCDNSYHQVRPIPPCVPFCEYVRSGCEATLLQQFGYRWPEHLNCSFYANENFNHASLCFGPTDIEQLKAIVPPSTDMGPTDPLLDFSIATDACKRHSLTFTLQLPDNIPEEALLDYEYSCDPQPTDFPKVFTDVTAKEKIVDKLDGFDLSTAYTCKVSLNSSELEFEASETVTTLDSSDKAVLIRFVNDTPTAREDTIYAEFTADPGVDQISCILLPRGFKPPRNCNSGSVTYTNLPPGQYFVRLTAKDHDRCAVDRLRRKVEVPCRIEVKYVKRGRKNMIVKFVGIGVGGAPLTSFTCSLNGQPAKPCESTGESPLKLPLSSLPLGSHQLEILLDDENCSAKASKIVNFTV